MSMLEFWQLTPFEFSLNVEAYGEKVVQDYKTSISIAYMTAYLHRVQRLPKLAKLLSDLNTKPKEANTMQDMFETVKSLNAAMGGSTIM